MALSRKEDHDAEEETHVEEIVVKLRQVDVLTSQGQSVADAVRSIGVTEVSVGPLHCAVGRFALPTCALCRGSFHFRRSPRASGLPQVVRVRLGSVSPEARHQALFSPRSRRN